MTPLRQRIFGAAFGLCLVLCARLASAEEGPDASVKSTPTPSWLAPRAEKPHAVAGGASVGLGRSLGVLLLAALLGGSALYLRSKKNQQPGAKAVQQLRVVSAAKLGPKAQLVLADVGGRKILLGVTDSTVNKLGWIEPDEAEEAAHVSVRPRTVLVSDLARPAVREVVTEATPARAQKRSFRDFLASAVGNLGHRDEDSAADAIATATHDTFTRSTPRTAEPLRKVEPAARKTGPQMLDVEGQAKGLLARLGEPRA